jgi:type I restriction enzyme S subunit
VIHTAPNWRSIVDFASVKGGKRMAKGVSLTSKDTGKPYVRVTDFRDYSIAVEQVLFIPNGYEKAISRYTISAKDVYISIAGTIGLVGQVPSSLEGANLTENAAKICIDDPCVSPQFLMYALSSAVCQDQIKQATAKNAQPKLALTRIEQLKVPLPSTLAEQHLIANALSHLRMVIKTHEHRIALSLELKRAAMRELFTKGLRGENQKETEIGLVPESWEVAQLADLASIERGRFLHRPRNEPRFYGGSSLTSSACCMN